MAKEVEFTIHADTNDISIETFGIKGQECTKLTEEIRQAIGGTIKEDRKKSEYYDRGQNVYIEKS